MTGMLRCQFDPPAWRQRDAWAWRPRAVGGGPRPPASVGRRSRADGRHAQGRVRGGPLAKDDFDARIGQAFASRTYAELAAVTVGIPAGPAVGPPPARKPSRRVSDAVRWGASGFVTPAILAIAFALNSLPGNRALGPVTFVIAFVYFVFWMSVGADMLWQWFCLSLPTARMCARCAHTAASHRAPTSCSVRLGSLRLFSRCSCAGYVPPGVSPKTADLRILSTRV